MTDDVQAIERIEPLKRRKALPEVVMPSPQGVAPPSRANEVEKKPRKNSAAKKSAAAQDPPGTLPPPGFNPQGGVALKAIIPAPVPEAEVVAHDTPTAEPRPVKTPATKRARSTPVAQEKQEARMPEQVISAVAPAIPAVETPPPARAVRKKKVQPDSPAALVVPVVTTQPSIEAETPAESQAPVLQAVAQSTSDRPQTEEGLIEEPEELPPVQSVEPYKEPEALPVEVEAPIEWAPETGPMPFEQSVVVFRDETQGPIEGRMMSPIDLIKPTPEYITLPADVFTLWQYMIGALAVFEMQGKTITEIQVNPPRFEHSVLKGLVIRIVQAKGSSEVDVQLLGSEAAIELLTQHVNRLEALLKKQEKGYNLKRLELIIKPKKDEK